MIDTDAIIRHLVPSLNSAIPHTEAQALLAMERAERNAALRIIFSVLTRRHHGLAA